MVQTPNEEGLTIYSDAVEGETGNWDWRVKFDITDGYIGITQWNDDSSDRVLLSPRQVQALKRFIEKPQ